jgi:predicted RNase H-like HicB family nuclease
MNEYHINVFYSVADGEWIADIPDLTPCSASGATPEEAVREVTIAKTLWLEVAREDGMPIPEPRYRPIYYLVPAPSSTTSPD